MSQIKVIQGEVFTDHRGIITSLNNFHFQDIKRCYFIHHPDEAVVRGWHGHQNERKWFYCVKGKFSVAMVKIDDWDNPSPDLKPEIFHLTEKNSRLVCVPCGYANCLKAWEKDSVMMVLSDKILEVALLDSWRYDKSLWIDWQKHIPLS
ncbi:MAG: WxcM-like domain-containing protein [Muribaculaceae bacterium]|nr:WxcM-like domain-containing protein [Muribaculaceae bacterium]